ncbi:MAG: hypothetical protein ACK4SY_09695 [Pyrobaculum sp.]
MGREVSTHKRNPYEGETTPTARGNPATATFIRLLPHPPRRPAVPTVAGLPPGHLAAPSTATPAPGLAPSTTPGRGQVMIAMRAWLTSAPTRLPKRGPQYQVP